MMVLHVLGSDAAGFAPSRLRRLVGRWRTDARHLAIAAAGGHAQVAAQLEGTGVARVDPCPPLSGPPSVRRYRALADVLRQADLILTYGYGAVDALIARRIFARDLPPLIHHEGVEDDVPGGRAIERRLVRRLALRAAFAVVVPSRSLRARATGDWRVAAERVHVFPDGIDTARARPRPLIARRRGEFVVATIAELTAEARLAELIRAVAPIPNARLVIAGGGGEGAALGAAAGALGMSDRLMLPGVVRDPAALLAGADLYVQPPGRAATEAQPLLEAMAAGLPVVAAPVGEVATLLAPENAPLLVDHTGYAATIMRIAGDGAARRAIGVANRRRAEEQFDADRLADAQIAVYEAALA